MLRQPYYGMVLRWLLKRYSFGTITVIKRISKGGDFQLAPGDFLLFEQMNNQICAKPCDYITRVEYQEQVLTTLYLANPYES